MGGWNGSGTGSCGVHYSYGARAPHRDRKVRPGTSRRRCGILGMSLAEVCRDIWRGDVVGGDFEGSDDNGFGGMMDAAYPSDEEDEEETTFFDRTRCTGGESTGALTIGFPSTLRDLDGPMIDTYSLGSRPTPISSSIRDKDNLGSKRTG
ncbi:hypothetical protein C8J56DRAFT_890447 [Mycena floridula]|nr:hypothetical protein C8J56DRAFT_890447 [Mycena floridula]